MLPELAVDRGFMTEFVAAELPCFALGLVEVERLPPKVVVSGPYR